MPLFRCAYPDEWLFLVSPAEVECGYFEGMLRLLVLHFHEQQDELVVVD